MDTKPKPKIKPKIKTPSSSGSESTDAPPEKLSKKAIKRKRKAAQERKPIRTQEAILSGILDEKIPVVKIDKGFSRYIKNQQICSCDQDFDNLITTAKIPLPISWRFCEHHTLAPVEKKSLLNGRFDFLRGARIFLTKAANRYIDLPKRTPVQISQDTTSQELPKDVSHTVNVFGKSIQIRYHILQSPPKPISWYPDFNGWELPMNKVDLKRSPDLEDFPNWIIRSHDVGIIVRQEAVSMIPPLLLDIQPDHAVLDMCASPGSKTQQILSAIIPGKGFVVANDSRFERGRSLSSNLQRHQTAKTIITLHEAQQYPSPRYPNGESFYFDRILCDVPCSGTGTIRKSHTAWETWSLRSTQNLHHLQFAIARRGVQLLKESGLLVYSTCSMDPIENEAVVTRLLRTFPESLELVDVSSKLPLLSRRPGLTKWKVGIAGEKRKSKRDNDFEKAVREQTLFSSWEQIKPVIGGHFQYLHRHFVVPEMFPPNEKEVKSFHLERCLRVHPHDQNTGGFFIAVFKKVDEVDPVAPSTEDTGTTGSKSETSPLTVKSEASTSKIQDLPEEEEVKPSVPVVPVVPVMSKATIKKQDISYLVKPIFLTDDSQASHLPPLLLQHLKEFLKLFKSKAKPSYFYARSSLAKKLSLVDPSVYNFLRLRRAYKLSLIDAGIPCISNLHSSATLTNIGYHRSAGFPGAQMRPAMLAAPAFAKLCPSLDISSLERNSNQLSQFIKDFPPLNSKQWVEAQIEKVTSKWDDTPQELLDSYRSGLFHYGGIPRVLLVDNFTFLMTCLSDSSVPHSALSPGYQEFLRKMLGYGSFLLAARFAAPSDPSKYQMVYCPCFLFFKSIQKYSDIANRLRIYFLADFICQEALHKALTQLSKYKACTRLFEALKAGKIPIDFLPESESQSGDDAVASTSNSTTNSASLENNNSRLKRPRSPTTDIVV